MVRKLLQGVSRPSNWLPVFPIGFFFILALVWPQNKLALITNGMVIGAWVLILRSYVPPFVHNLRSDNEHPENNFIGGVLLGSTAIAASRIWSIAIILAGKPAWMINHWFQSFCYMLAALSWYYLLRAPGNSKSAKYITYALIIAVAVLVLGLLITED